MPPNETVEKAYVRDASFSHRRRQYGYFTPSGVMRVALVEAAHVAANHHPHWKAELARLQPWIGYNRAIVAIARKLLVTVWYVLARKVADRFAEEEMVSKKMLHIAYEVGKENRAGKSAAQFVRERMDTLGLGSELTSIPWGSKKPIPLPPSRLKEKERRPK